MQLIEDLRREGRGFGVAEGVVLVKNEGTDSG